MQDALRTLIENYCAILAQQVNEIAGHLRDMEAGAAPAAPFADALDLVHQISGLGGTMGYRELSDAALALEGIMRKFEHSSETLLPEDLDSINAMFATVADLAGAAKPESSTLFNVDLDALTADLN